MDFSTKYLGFDLPSPFIAGAGPLSDNTDSAKRLEDEGASALVMRSLFEEQIEEEALATHAATESHAESHGEALSYFARHHEFVIGPDEYLERVRQLKEAVDIPVVGSLNGYTTGGWLSYANSIEQAGADAIELNVYYVASDPNETAALIEENTVAMVQDVKKSIGIPLAVKLSPFYTSMANLSKRLVDAGADGLVLFNRYFELDIDVDELEMTSELRLSSPGELLLRLRWLAIVSSACSASLGVTGGVHTSLDAIKAVMAGADIVQVVSAVLMGGPGRLKTLESEMLEWMTEKEYESLAQMKGSMDADHCPDPDVLFRGNYMSLLQTY